MAILKQRIISIGESRMKNNQTLDILYKIRKEIQKSENTELLTQIDYTIKKTYEDLFVISFIGHFSAGKSSLINYLLGEEILPSSPIPTTTKTVQVEMSEVDDIEAFIDLNHFVEIETIDELKKLNRTDVDIEYIKLRHQTERFNLKTVFQDTPGVDSTTRAHEESTNTFLLGSDYIFFTVEYNHVESETNLKMLKEIESLNIPYSLIINQIDKHDEKEIAYDTFINRIQTTFKNWDIHPENIYTTSIYETPYRENDALVDYIKALEKKEAEFKERYRTRIIKNIEEEHLNYLDDEINMQGVLTEDKDEVLRQIDYLDEQINDNQKEDIVNDEKKLNEYIKSNVKDIVKNAYLYPYDVKSPIEMFFKIENNEVPNLGFFGKKKKLKELRDKTLVEIKIKIQKTLDSEINTQINSMFQDLSLSGAYFNFKWKDELITEADTSESNEKFVRLYLDNLKQHLSREISNEAVVFKENLSHQKLTDSNDLSPLKEERENLKKALHLLDLKSVFKSESYKHLYIHMDEELKHLGTNIEVPMEEIKESTEALTPTQFLAEDTVKSLDILAIQNILKELENRKRYKDASQLFTDKLNRLKENHGNMSVFGGFSAGKSTFINALIGSEVLTTSPNPTTASITELSSEDKSYVRFKTEEVLLKTTIAITGKETHSMDAQIKLLKSKKDIPEVFKPFVKGLLDNFETYRDRLGQKVEATNEEIDFMTSNDEHALYIQRAYIGLDREILKKATIVDSPGINSINQRHTNETINIIENSDMIIYVAYFNHIFTQSDEQFLKYLQSIKGQRFAITVVINAIDLRKNDKELDDVVNYMSDTLNALEIKHRIYPVSSRAALTSEEPYFIHAKKELIKHLEKESSQMIEASIKENLKHLIQRIESNITEFKEGTTHFLSMVEARKNVLPEVEDFSAFKVNEDLHVEKENLFTYLNRQLELKIYDFLSQHVTMNEAKDKTYIKNGATELKELVNHFVNIELSTIFNTLYRKAYRQLEVVYQTENKRLMEANILSDLMLYDGQKAQLSVTLSESVFKEGLEQVSKSTKTPRLLKESLLNFSKSIVSSIAIDQLEQDVNRNVEAFLKDIDNKSSDSKEQVITELNREVTPLSESDYKEDKELLLKIKQNLGE